MNEIAQKLGYNYRICAIWDHPEEFSHAIFITASRRPGFIWSYIYEEVYV